MPPSSLYKPFLENMVQRLWMSQGPNAMPAEEFARRVVGESLRERPGRWMTLGGSAWLFWVLGWVPRTWALGLFWRRFSKVQEGAVGK